MKKSLVKSLMIFVGTLASSSVLAVEPLVVVPDPPAIQMLVPGFEVSELPVDLTNINNLRYRRDGKLYALGYDGNVSLLSDLDGDGLEETVSRFFENKDSLRGPIGMAVIPDDHALLSEAKRSGGVTGGGVIVASKGKVSAILDLDGDDLAETERVIATGWTEIPQNVDAVGVAIHPDDGSIYFSLGTAAYNNAYLLDKEGKSSFDLSSQRGTIQRIAPDLSTVTTICTGIRFAIGMEFDSHRELFVSEQEGATWLANGNPFDELLRIESGRHYGFPPRHPKHLPHVFDEPSLFDYAPQHQSTCGMAFNTPSRSDGPIFGPLEWRGDLFVCGESRGKLYRTKLVRNSDGDYVAANQLISCLPMLTVDCCLSPLGDLLIACHSGGPDWGTGPKGIGKLYRIRYVDRDIAQPISAGVTSPQEVRVAFDRPLDPQHLKNLAAQTEITYGEYVAAGDRFETIRPGYAVTQLQQLSPRYKLPIYAASVTGDRRTLILTTAPRHASSQFAIKLPGLGRQSEEVSPMSAFAQRPDVDLGYSLQGIQAHWESNDNNHTAWDGTLSHLDLEVAKTLAPQDEEYRRIWELLEQPGELTLATQIDPRGWLFPTVQPGSKLDYERAEDTWIRKQAIRLRSSRDFSIETLDPISGALSTRTSAMVNGMAELIFSMEQEQPALIPITLRMKTGLGKPTIRINWMASFADGAERFGPTPLHRLLVPWAKLEEMLGAPATERTIPELANASWGRGRQVFLSEEAACSKCHTAHGLGGQLGPDLSNLIHRDYASVFRDLTQPSFAINPDFITYTILTRDSRVLNGVLRSEGERLLIGDKDGKVTILDRSEVEEMKPSSVSVMPEGLAARLGSKRTHDLMAFLLNPPPHMPFDSELPPPPPARRRSEVAKILAPFPLESTPASSISSHTKRPLKSLRILLVAGKKDHGPGEHDYPAWLRVWGELLSAAQDVTVDTAMDWPTSDQIQNADTIVFYQKGSWNDLRAKSIDGHLAKGRGLVFIHWAIEGGSAAASFAERIGLSSDAKRTKFRHGPLDVDLAIGNQHPIGRNFDQVHFYDESYWSLLGDPSRLRILGTAMEADQARPLFWTMEQNPGRVFVLIPGHYSWTFDDPLFRTILLRGIAWSSQEPVDRLNELVTVGVTLAD